MAEVAWLDALILVLAGGIFGWLLGKLPELWIYAAMAVLVLLVILNLSVTSS